MLRVAGVPSLRNYSKFDVATLPQGLHLDYILSTADQNDCIKCRNGNRSLQTEQGIITNIRFYWVTRAKLRQVLSQTGFLQSVYSRYIKNFMKSWAVAQLTECLLSMHEVVGFISTIT